MNILVLSTSPDFRRLNDAITQKIPKAIIRKKSQLRVEEVHFIMKRKLTLLRIIALAAISPVNAGAAAIFNFDSTPSSKRASSIRLLSTAAVCDEDPSASFFLKTKKDDITTGIFQTCAWLGDRMNKQHICDNSVASWTDGTGPANEVCPKTCGYCNTTAPTLPLTTSSSTAPTKSSSTSSTSSPTEKVNSPPTTTPTLCDEDSKALFFLKTAKHDPSIPIYQTCAWLKGRNQKNEICNSNVWWGSGSTATGPANEVCVKTCNNCPTEAPTKEPTIAPKAKPTIGAKEAPSHSPTKNPTVSPTAEPTSAPTKALTEAPTKGPTSAPTSAPTAKPTKAPTVSPTKNLTKAPTKEFTTIVTTSPTVSDSDLPSSPPVASGGAATPTVDDGVGGERGIAAAIRTSDCAVLSSTGAVTLVVVMSITAILW